MKNLDLALLDFDPEAYDQAWEAAYQWGHRVELPITEPEQVRPSIEAIRLGKVAVDLFVCNRANVNDGLYRKINMLTNKAVVSYEVSEVDFYGFKVSPQRGIHDTFDDLFDLPDLGQSRQ